MEGRRRSQIAVECAEKIKMKGVIPPPNYFTPWAIEHGIQIQIIRRRSA